MASRYLFETYLPKTTGLERYVFTTYFPEYGATVSAFNYILTDSMEKYNIITGVMRKYNLFTDSMEKYNKINDQMKG